MINPSDRTRYIQESVIREMTRIAIQEEAVNLAQGMPDYSPPDLLVRAAQSAIGGDFNQYSITYGDEGLRRAIAEDLKKATGVSYNPESEITVTCGVSEAIIASLMAVVNPGDEVIFFEPYYENYFPGILMAGGIPVPVELQAPKWDLSIQSLQEAISAKSKALIINSPMNPTGKVFSFEELSMIGEICLQAGIVIISDEIYRHFVYTGKFESPASIAGLSGQTIVNGGFSKIFACTGWRIGYSAAKGEIGEAVRKAHDYLTICAPHPFQIACREGLLKLDEDYYARALADYLRRRDLLCYGLMDLGFKLEIPKGAYYVLADFTDIFTGDDVEFTGFLAVEKGVAVVPGSSFYMDGRKGKNLVRFSFAASEKSLMTALDRIGERFKNRRTNRI